MFALALLAALSAPAQAFCGFFVSGADAALYNSATLVVLMREGTQTVLSMQNNYQGPPEDFALVVPVPTVLSEEDVRPLPREVFQRVDQMAAPRLVEYWEHDPCQLAEPTFGVAGRIGTKGVGLGGLGTRSAGLGVTVEAEFKVAEYEIVILSAEDSGGLDAWLRQEGYRIPPGAERALRPYVEQGTKFFVARVDAEALRFLGEESVLTPLRVSYESEQLALPIRLGLLNAQGPQDLLVHVLARGQRYETANYNNLTIPTNLSVPEQTAADFPAFYEALFQETVGEDPRAVVTEYSWVATGCDPCPTPALNAGELRTLGGELFPPSQEPWVLTRLHYRFDADSLGEDLVFRAAPAIVGGRGLPDREGQLSQGVEPAPHNAFQGRYVILHPWEGEVRCELPAWGQWGARPGEASVRVTPAPSPLGSAR
ncbi:MAG: DUF2330 domain-containing protein [Alphaproteobacteria bacterium]|nr:DUF2330 domain-containing protein [Alphaproteobacteria bacterium]MCB9793563.1 DUF2330 domain-containing protein [Alphaproteobacteria bacterium]